MAEPDDNVFDPADFIQQERRSATVTALQGLDGDPDKAARALQLSRATGAGPNIVYDNLENFEAQTKSALAARLLRDNEYLRQFVNTQPLAAQLASDDYGNLDKVSQDVSKAWPGRYGGAGSLGAFIHGAYEGVKEGFGEGGIGSWMVGTEGLNSPHGTKGGVDKKSLEFVQQNPLAAATISVVASPVELVLRSLSAAIRGLTRGAGEAAEEFALTVTGDEGYAKRIGREASAYVEWRTTQPPNIKPAITPEVIQKARTALEKARPWLDRGVEPPLGIDPTIDQIKIEQSKRELDNLAEAEKSAQKSLLKERSPEAFAEMIRGQTQAQIGISPDAVRRLYGDDIPVWLDGKLGFVPRLADQLQLAELSGSDILIPVADWLAYVDPAIAKELRDDIRVRPGGVTKNEAVRVKESFEVYHGSEAVFEAFDTGKIGSGEGAQAYAYGHYVAENQKVAEEYKNAASKLAGWTNTDWDPSMKKEGNVYRIRVKRQPEEFLDWETEMDSQPAGKAILSKMDPNFKQVLEDYLESHDQPDLATLTGEQFHRLLERWAAEDSLPGVKGDAANPHFKREASEYIGSLGIPGVRFLDQGSRDKIKPKAEQEALLNEYQEMLKGEQETLAEYTEKAKTQRPGWNAEFIKNAEANIKRLEEGIATLRDPQVTRNYVIFSDSDLEILDRNGQAVRAIRESAALKPIVEEKRLTLRSEGMVESPIFHPAEEKFGVKGEQVHAFRIIDEVGRSAAELYVAVENGGKRLFIDDIRGLDTTGPNTLGPAGMRDILRQLKEAFPQAEELTGLRVSGAREKSGKLDYATIKLSEPVETWEIDKLTDDWRRMVKEELPADVTLTAAEKYTASEARIVEEVQKVLTRIAPGLEDVRTVQKVELGGREVSGVFISPEAARPIVAVSLDSKDAGKTARHEAIHYLREYNFFTDAEWAALEQAAPEWMKKHKTAERYKKYEQDQTAMLEEAIADEFGAWGSATETVRKHYDKAVAGAFEKMVQFFKEVLEAVKEMFGHTPKIDELFERIESGEVGRRQVGEQVGEGGAKASTGPKQGELDVTRMEDKKPFDRAAAIGMTEEQMKRYLKLIDKQRQEDLAHATKKLVEAEKRKQTATWKENERKVREEVAEDFNTRPDVQVDEYFRTGRLYGEAGPKPKLAEDALTPEQKAALPESFVAKNGMAPDDVASLFGYTSGREMIEHLSAYTKARKTSGMQPMAFNRRLVDAEVERRMQERYGDLQENVLEAVKDQVFSETQLDMLHEETVAAAMNAKQQIPLPKDAIKAEILRQVNESPLETLKLRDYETAAGKAGREFEMALLKGDAMEAFRQKQRQYMAIIAAKEVMAVEKEVAQFERKAKQYRGREVPKAVDPEFGTYVQALLNEANVKVGQSAEELSTGLKFYGYGSLDNFVTDKSSYGYELAVPEGFKAKPVEEMTVGEFREFKAAIDTLDKAGRDALKQDLAGERVDKAVFEKMVIDHLEERPVRELKRGKLGEELQGTKGWNWLYGIDAPLTRIEELVKALDFREEMGPLFKALIIPYAKSKARAHDLLADLSKKFEAIKEGNGKEWQRTLSEELPGDFVFDTRYEVPLKLTRWNMIKMMLNMGTESNFGKLAYGFAAAEAGGKVDQAAVQGMQRQIERFVATHATKEDWKFVQQVFDTFEGWRGEADTLYRNLSGVAPKWIPSRAIDTPFGQMKGGYFPLIPDRSRPLPGHMLIKEGGEAEPKGPLGKDFFKATTHTPFYKERTGANYFVDITGGPEAIAGRMQQMIHDLSYRDFVVEAGKVIYNPKIMNAIRKHYGPEYAAQLDPWLKRVANEFTASEADLAEVNNTLGRFRFNLVASALPLNYAVMLSPGLGTLNPKVVYAYNANHAANKKLVLEHSQELKHLIFSLDRDVGERFKEVAGKQGWSGLQKRAVEAMFWPLLRAEQGLRSMTFYGKFMEAKEKGFTDYEASALADSLVRERHGSMTPGDLPNLMANKNEFVKMSTLFMGYFTTMRNWARQAPDQVRQGDVSGLATTLWGVFGTAAIMNAALFEKRKESDTIFSYFGRAIASTPLNMIPFAREWYSYASEGHHPKSPLFGLGTATYKIIKDGYDFSQGKYVKKPIRDVASFAGSALGVPGSLQIGRTTEFINDVRRGAQRPRNEVEWMRGIFTGEARLKK